MDQLAVSALPAGWFGKLIPPNPYPAMQHAVKHFESTLCDGGMLRSFLRNLLNICGAFLRTH